MRATGELRLARTAALHALAYCPRLFYLEEVEEIRVPMIVAAPAGNCTPPSKPTRTANRSASN